MNKEMIINEDNVKQAIKIMMAENDVDSMSMLARELDIKETTFRSSLNNKALRLKEFIKIAELLGYDLIIKKKK